MNILQVTPSLGLGGAESVAIWLADKFKNYNKSISLYSNKSGFLIKEVKSRRIKYKVYEKFYISLLNNIIINAKRIIKNSYIFSYAKKNNPKLCNNFIFKPLNQHNYFASIQYSSKSSFYKSLKNNNIGIVHFHSISSLYLIDAAIKANCIIIYTHHNVLSECHSKEDIDFLKINIDKINHIICVSKSSANDFIEATSINPCKVSIINNPSLAFGGKKRSISTLKNIGTASSLGPVKRIDVILDALLLLKQMNLSVPHLFIAGGDYESIIFWKKYVQSHNLSDYVTFYGKLPPEKMSLFYNSIDCLVISSDSESSPLQCIESISYGIPVISTSLPALYDTLKESAIYFKPADYNGLSKKLLNLFDSPQLLSKHSSSSFKLWQDEYHPNLIFDQYKSVYKKYYIDILSNN